MTSYPDLTKDLNHLTDLYEKLETKLLELKQEVAALQKTEKQP